jgi:hypothetical protein
MIAAAILDISCRKPLNSLVNYPFHFQTNPKMYRIFPYRTYALLIIYAEPTNPAVRNKTGYKFLKMIVKA